MADFPTILYRVPGPHVAPRGTYDFIGVEDQGALDAALAAGWHETLAGAMSPVAKVLQEIAEAGDAIDDMSPATRDEMEQKARELGVPFNARTKDDVLAGRIAEALR